MYSNLLMKFRTIPRRETLCCDLKKCTTKRILNNLNTSQTDICTEKVLASPVQKLHPESLYHPALNIRERCVVVPQRLIQNKEKNPEPSPKHNHGIIISMSFIVYVRVSAIKQL